ncbi:MAG TPA: hypothetical protein PLX23_09930 [Candidatus Hydrogenedens sp.]|mgnify:CR=1 FL=1|nr:hypothetical protein [Candidatus Hydrogenedens sp.]
MLHFLIALLFCGMGTATDENLTIEKIPNTIGTWVREQEVQEFNPDNLYNYIDGDADRYLPYHFQKLIVVFFKDKNSPEKTIEVQIYQMATLLDAFGIYSVHRDRNKDSFFCGTDGFIGENQAMFYQAQYFIKLLTGKNKDTKTDLETIGKALSQILPKKTEVIREMKCLDLPTKIPRSENYLAKDVLAQSFFPCGFTALYKMSTSSATGFIVMFDDQTKAQKGWEEYKNYLDEINAEYQIGKNEIRITAPNSEIAIASLQSTYIVGVWMPNGNLTELEKIYSQILTCLKNKNHLTN